MAKEPKILKSHRFPRKLYAEFAKAAADQDRPVTWLLEKAMGAWLRRKAKGRK